MFSGGIGAVSVAAIGMLSGGIGAACEDGVPKGMFSGVSGVSVVGSGAVVLLAS